MAIRRHIYQVAQRMLIKARAGGPYKPPTEGAKGSLGVFAPQLFQEWPGTFLEREFGVPPEYYVRVGNGITETISEDWLEPAPPGLHRHRRTNIHGPHSLSSGLQAQVFSIHQPGELVESLKML